MLVDDEAGHKCDPFKVLPGQNLMLDVSEGNPTESKRSANEILSAIHRGSPPNPECQWGDLYIVSRMKESRQNSRSLARVWLYPAGSLDVRWRCRCHSVKGIRVGEGARVACVMMVSWCHSMRPLIYRALCSTGPCIRAFDLCIFLSPFHPGLTLRDFAGRMYWVLFPCFSMSGRYV